MPAALLRRRRRWPCERRELAIDALDAGRQRAAGARPARAATSRWRPSWRRASRRKSGGSPFFIRALVDHVQAESQLAGPGLLAEGTTLDEVLRRRFSRLRSRSAAAAGRDRGGRPSDRRGRCLSRRRHRRARSGAAQRAARGAAWSAAPAATCASSRRITIACGSPWSRRWRVRRSPTRIAGWPRRSDAKGTVDPEWLAAHYHGAGDPVARRDALHARRREIAATAAGLRSRGRPVPARARARAPDTGSGPLPLLVGGPTRWPTPAAASWRPRRTSRPPRWRRPTRRSSCERKAGYQYCISGHIDEGRAVLADCMAQVGLRLPRQHARGAAAAGASGARGCGCSSGSGRLRRLPRRTHAVCATR